MQHFLAVVVAVLAWWLSTGAVLFAAGREAPRRVPLVIFATLLAIAGLWAVHEGGRIGGLPGVYMGFFGGLAVWAWHEITFLAGIITGPRRTACPPGAIGLERFKAAFATIRDHELGMVATLGLLVLIAWDAPDRTGLMTFALLWAMRISSKLLLFMGARHVATAMLPPRLDYLATYFRTDRTTPAFPVFAGAIVLVFLGLAVTAGASAHPAEAVAATLLATFAGLAVLEHLLLVAPVSDAALWRWAMPHAPSGGVAAGITNSTGDGSKVSSSACGRHPAAAA